ncbi:IS701 family transposase [Roseinatronobacter alkalisoli]|uniref:IS701 family transposase n=1 Tax=Roseinatronobacter alkalisoli TaxID=3028235 RepID=A0ABT5TFT6_9RHOB|nr:IS701 family transposase [Roseinatronobacter sp. HJB301]MDD7973995.1 IS701 family transposase [Roseinatronobacter sp. HJB301]
MSVSDWAGVISDWRAALEGMKARIASAFIRSEQRASAGVFIDGLLSGAERKTGWMLAEEAGLARPYKIQSLLGRSSWSADELCKRVRDYALEALADPDGVLVIDETGFLKKGTHSVGVARQYSGTAGRIENSQIGVFASYASRWGHALIDRRLYLPKSWANDPERRAKAHVPEDITFATKPAMACEMVTRLLNEGIPCAFVLADAVYGADFRFRHMLEERQQSYVLAVRSNQTLRFMEEWTLIQTDPVKMVAALPGDAWMPLSAGEGAKGPRLYDWARIQLNYQAPDGFSRWMLARRSLRDPEAIAYYFAFARSDTTLAELAAAAGLRWTIEECFLRAKDDLGLDHCEARSWHGWHRHISLVMAAAAFLARLGAEHRRSGLPKPNKTSPDNPVAAI